MTQLLSSIGSIPSCSAVRQFQKKGGLYLDGQLTIEVLSLREIPSGAKKCIPLTAETETEIEIETETDVCDVV